SSRRRHTRSKRDWSSDVCSSDLGLIGGIAAWFASDVRVIGVEPQRCPTLTAALAAGKPVDVEVGGVAADALGAGRAGTIGLAIRSEERRVGERGRQRWSSDLCTT